MIDLHTHSTFSDGLLTPEQLVEEAAKLGLSALALTDHDTTAGTPRLLEAAQRAGMVGITGVEVSAEPPPGGTLHILGYFVRHEDPFLQEHLRWIREGRHQRNLDMIQRLNRAGVRITYDEVRAHAPDDVVARPHFARALIAKGVVRNKREAFDRFLARGKPGYADRRRLQPAAAIELIRRTGGVPVLAHPFTLKLERDALHRSLKEWTDAGLGGIECWYPEHSSSMRRNNLKLAREFGLIPCGGSDFHGLSADRAPQVHGLGCMAVPDETVEQLRAAARAA